MDGDEVTSVGPGGISFAVADPEHRYARVRVDLGLGEAAARPELVWVDGAWRGEIPMPDLARLEYRFEADLRFPDPENPHSVGTGTDRRSVLELPGYRPPSWLGGEAASPGRAVTVETAIGSTEGMLWEAPDLTGPAPLLVAHDGPAFAQEAALLDYLTYLAARRDETGHPIRVRALLLPAHEREVWYAADDAYAAALAQIVETAQEELPVTSVIGMGASLGALAVLHAQWRRAPFDGLFLQSGSFFTAATDPQEQGFARWGAVTSFVAEVRAGRPALPLPPVAITCGVHEENVGNNRLMAHRLRELTEVAYLETRQMHNMVAWRDALDPALADLIATVRRRESPPGAPA